MSRKELIDSVLFHDVWNHLRKSKYNKILGAMTSDSSGVSIDFTCSSWNQRVSIEIPDQLVEKDEILEHIIQQIPLTIDLFEDFYSHMKSVYNTQADMWIPMDSMDCMVDVPIEIITRSDNSIPRATKTSVKFHPLDYRVDAFVYLGVINGRIEEIPFEDIKLWKYKHLSRQECLSLFVN